MKKRLLYLILALMTLLYVLPVSAQGESGVSTNVADLELRGNCGKNYIRGNGSAHSPAESFLYANEKGGVTLVQYIGKDDGVTVAEFDENLDFVNCRTIPVEELTKWGGFCAGPEYNYIVYATGDNTLRVNQYDKSWAAVNTTTITVGNTVSLIENDMDLAADSSVLYIATNHYMEDDGVHLSHQSSLRLAISAASLVPMVEQSGMGNYVGYCSHSYVPQIICNNGSVYIVERCDNYPDEGIFMSQYGFWLSGGSMHYVTGMSDRQFGNLGGVAPISGAGGDGVVAAYAKAPIVKTENGYDYWAKSTDADIYLYVKTEAEQGVVRVSYTRGAGTPQIGTVDNGWGYVMWNPDIYGEEERDILYYAAYAANGGPITVGGVNKREGHYLSDCEPISFNGALLWFTVEQGDVVFHQLGARGGPMKKIVHTAPEAVEALETNCARPGHTAGVRCGNCDGTVRGIEEIPALPHTEAACSLQEATCTQTGLTEGVECSVCGAVLMGREEIPLIPHTEEIIPATPGTCMRYGLGEGVKCSACDAVLVRPQRTQLGDHVSVPVPGYPSTCQEHGLSDGAKCSECGTIISRGETLPLGDHEGMPHEAIPPTTTTCGLTAGTACKHCGAQLTGGMGIPELMLTILSHSVEGDKLKVLAEVIDGEYLLVAAFYDEEGAMLGVDTHFFQEFGDGYMYDYEDDEEPRYDLSFDLPAGSVSYRVFMLEAFYRSELYNPVCDPRGGSL